MGVEHDDFLLHIGRVALRESGQEDALKARLRGRIQAVLDSIEGRKTPRNLFGLRPLHRQELFAWYEDQQGPAILRVAGRPFDFGREVGEDLIEQMITKWEGWGFHTDEVTGKETPVVTQIDRYRSPSGLVFQRRVQIENRLITIGEVPELVSGFPITFAVYWEVLKVNP